MLMHNEKYIYFAAKHFEIHRVGFFFFFESAFSANFLKTSPPLYLLFASLPDCKTTRGWPFRLTHLTHTSVLLSVLGALFWKVVDYSFFFFF